MQIKWKTCIFFIIKSCVLTVMLSTLAKSIIWPSEWSWTSLGTQVKFNCKLLCVGLTVVNLAGQMRDCIVKLIRHCLVQVQLQLFLLHSWEGESGWCMGSKLFAYENINTRKGWKKIGEDWGASPRSWWRGGQGWHREIWWHGKVTPEVALKGWEETGGVRFGCGGDA